MLPLVNTLTLATSAISSFDDIFDIGELKDDPEGAKAVLDNLVDSMHGSVTPSTKFVQAHQKIYDRMEQTAYKGKFCSVAYKMSLS